jgi:6,7-dimethyl-8-ribityllumazine synthase
VKIVEKVRLGIVVSEFNYDITALMLQRAIEHANFLGAQVDYVFKVPGAFDMPLAIRELLKKDDVDAVATLGMVIEGETEHDKVVTSQVSRKITDLSLDYGKPVALGVAGPRMTRAQGTARIDEYAKRSVESAVKLARRMRKVAEEEPGEKPRYIQ